MALAHPRPSPYGSKHRSRPPCITATTYISHLQRIKTQLHPHQHGLSTSAPFIILIQAQVVPTMYHRQTIHTTHHTSSIPHHRKNKKSKKITNPISKHEEPMSATGLTEVTPPTPTSTPCRELPSNQSHSP